MQEEQYAYWLGNIAGVGSKTLLRLLREIGNPLQLYRSAESELKGILSPHQLKEWKRSREMWDLPGEYQKLQNRNIQFVSWPDSHYPKRLRDIPNPPYALYVKGRLPQDEQYAVAVIGARNCSEYGKYMANEFGTCLAANRIQVISGMARGIDGIAQRGVWQAGGATFAVLGCGVDICYPREHERLYEKIAGTGGILSEYALQTEPLSKYFPPRNRIISGLADAVLVIEAGEQSGTMITVDMALEQGREVFAMPGRITDSLSCGCNSLIRQGAGIAVSPERFLEDLKQIDYQNRISGTEHQTVLPADAACVREEGIRYRNISIREEQVLALLDLQFQELGIIYSQSKKINPEVTLPMLMQQLLELQLRGLVEQTGGQYRKIFAENVR